MFSISELDEKGVIYGDAGLQRPLQGALLELSDGNGVNSEPRCQRQLRGCVLLGEDILTHLLDSSNRA